MSNPNEILKKCCRCEIIQLIENFNKDKNRKDGLCPLCISCRKYSYIKNMDKIKKYNEQNRERRNTYLKNNQWWKDIEINRSPWEWIETESYVNHFK